MVFCCGYWKSIAIIDCGYHYIKRNLIDFTPIPHICPCIVKLTYFPLWFCSSTKTDFHPMLIRTIKYGKCYAAVFLDLRSLLLLLIFATKAFLPGLLLKIWYQLTSHLVPPFALYLNINRLCYCWFTCAKDKKSVFMFLVTT